MSIAELDKIDGIGTNKEESVLRLMISDHMNWDYEDLHLEILQDKINVYLQYLETKQYVEKYGDDFKKFIIDIYFKEKITENCFKFLETASTQLNPLQIKVNIHFE